MEVGALFDRFVCHGINIYDVTIQPSRSSRINPTLKVCEHNRVAHASLHRLEPLRQAQAKDGNSGH